MPLPIMHRRISRKPFTAPHEPIVVLSAPVIRLGTLHKQFFEEDFQVAVHRKVRSNQWFLELRRINVNLDFESVRRERLPVITYLTNIQTGAQYQEQICILHGKVSCASADRSRSSAEQWIIRCD